MDVRLPGHPLRVSSSSVATVRRLPQASAQLRSLLWSTFACGHRDRERMDDAALVLSELVGNAVRHGEGDRLQVHLRRRGDVLRIAVRDGSAVGPVPRDATVEDESGRGLLIIEALSHRWGWQPRPGGKVVWADVPC
jgi:anti-sigma regulatory factor (Ser/Thr protein kinase)